MRKAITTILCLVILIAIGGVILVRHMSHIYGPIYTPQHDMDKLLTIANTSRPLQEALERYKNERGHYPSTITNLFPAYLQPTNAPEDFFVKDWGGWDYFVQATDSYELYFQLCWDGGLFCEHSVVGTNHWSWNIGNGAVDLTQEIERK